MYPTIEARKSEEGREGGKREIPFVGVGETSRGAKAEHEGVPLKEGRWFL